MPESKLRPARPSLGATGFLSIEDVKVQEETERVAVQTRGRRKRPRREAPGRLFFRLTSLYGHAFSLRPR